MFIIIFNVIDINWVGIYIIDEIFYNFLKENFKIGYKIIYKIYNYL